MVIYPIRIQLVHPKQYIEPIILYLSIITVVVCAYICNRDARPQQSYSPARSTLGMEEARLCIPISGCRCGIGKAGTQGGWGGGGQWERWSAWE